MIVRFIISSVFCVTSIATYAADVQTKLPAVVNTPVVTASSILQTIIGLVVVLMVIALGAYLLRRFGNISSMNNGVIKIVASLSIGPRDRIVLVQAGNQQLLVGISPGRMQTLCELDTPIKIEKSDANVPGHFQNKLFSAIKNQSYTKK